MTLYSIEIILSILIMCYIVINAWKYGVKERRFCQSYLLLTFYVMAFFAVGVSIGYGVLGIEHTRFWNYHLDHFDF